jgi:hypothetical protein
MNAEMDALPGIGHPPPTKPADQSIHASATQNPYGIPTAMSSILNP